MSKALLRTPAEDTHTAAVFEHEAADLGEVTPPTPEEIAAAAYALYIERGAQDGRDIEDWLEAEQLLLERRADALRRRTVS